MNFYEAISPLIKPSIFVMAGISLCLLFVVLSIKSRLNKEIAKGNETKMCNLLDVLYTIFIVLISLFPLMGMFGTVCALITLDISGANEDLKSNFFQALDTTGMGLIFAIVFKFVNSIFQSGIEECLAKAKKFLENGGANE